MSSRWFHRSCPICEATCGLRVEADPESREVLRIEGNPDDPISQGHICPKAYALKGVFEDPDRLRRPIRRRSPSRVDVGVGATSRRRRASAVPGSPASTGRQQQHPSSMMRRFSSLT